LDVKVIYTSTSKRGRILPNVIAFDLDETIGSFSYFHSIWARLEPDMRTQDTFNEIMDLYPEFMRVGILSILRYIRVKQQSGACLPIYIYTNNQCEDTKWIYYLMEYVESRVGVANLFARPIFAFKIGDRKIEPGRTTHEKTYSDFVRCTMLSTSHELCFIDDVYHKKMKNRRVYYIQPPPYVHSVPYREVIQRFVTSDIYKTLYPDKDICEPILSNILPNEHTFSEEQDREECKITNKIMYHIREFFLITSRRRFTKKRVSKLGNFTRKKVRRQT
jgi:hypothetical protein